MSAREHSARSESLPCTIFRKQAEGIVKQLVEKLGPYCEKEKIATLLLEYLRLGKVMVKVPFPRETRKVKAIDMAENFLPAWAGPNFEVIGQSDFESSTGLLMSDASLLLVQPVISRARQEARELHLSWSVAQPILEEIVRRLYPDKRPRPVQLGEIRARIVEELVQIRSSGQRFPTFEQFRTAFPHFIVVEIVSARPFDDEDRELLMAPQRWAGVTTHCHGILKRYWNKSEETLMWYRKEYNKATKGRKRRRR